MKNTVDNMLPRYNYDIGKKAGLHGAIVQLLKHLNK